MAKVAHKIKMPKKVKAEIGGQCQICLQHTMILDVHHIWPQFAGGTDGPTANLCTSCHSGIHRQSMSFISKKKEKTRYFPPDQMERAAPLIRWLVVAIQQASEGRRGDNKSKVVIEVDASFLSLLHMCKVDAGHKNLSVFCAAVLRGYVNSKL